MRITLEPVEVCNTPSKKMVISNMCQVFIVVMIVMATAVAQEPEEATEYSAHGLACRTPCATRGQHYTWYVHIQIDYTGNGISF